MDDDGFNNDIFCTGQLWYLSAYYYIILPKEGPHVVIENWQISTVDRYKISLLTGTKYHCWHVQDIALTDTRYHCWQVQYIAVDVYNISLLAGTRYRCWQLQDIAIDRHKISLLTGTRYRCWSRHWRPSCCHQGSRCALTHVASCPCSTWSRWRMDKFALSSTL